jgi:hypothetical protein
MNNHVLCFFSSLLQGDHHIKTMPMTINRWLNEVRESSVDIDAISALVYKKSESDMLHKADKADVYTKNEVIQHFSYNGRRSLVGFAKLMFDTDTTFYDLEPPFNLTAAYVDSKTMLLSFVHHVPSMSGGGYNVDFASANLDLDYRNGTEGQYLYSSDRVIESFKMNLYGKQLKKNQAYVIKVFYDDMDPI